MEALATTYQLEDKLLSALLKRSRIYIYQSKFDSLGIHHERVGVLDSAIYYYQEGLEVDPANKMRFCNNLGKAYLRKSDIMQGVQYLELAMQEAQALNNLNAEAVIANNIGTAYGEIENNEKAYEYFLKSLDLKGQIGDESWRPGHVAIFYSPSGNRISARKKIPGCP